MRAGDTSTLRLRSIRHNTHLHAQRTHSDTHHASTLTLTRTTPQQSGIGSRAGGGVLEYHLDSSSHTHLSHCDFHSHLHSACTIFQTLELEVFIVFV